MRRPGFSMIALVGLGLAGCGCPDGQGQCGDFCVPLQSDNLNCGACGVACTAGQTCLAGRCAISCQPGFTECAGACRDLQTDDANCGACASKCASGQQCVAGKCTVSCAEGLTVCSGACHDLKNDRLTCGDCAKACADGEVCAAGVCSVSCVKGLTNCSGNCRDLQTDVANCGACGKVCDSGQACVAGQCKVSCQAGLTECEGGCHDLQTANKHCGACSSPCAAGQSCVAGKCELSCQMGLTNCGGSCRDVQTDNQHCGACSSPCAAGKTCVAGKCEVVCATGLTPCNGDCVNLQTDGANCGACKQACPVGKVCASGKCAAACASPLVDCSGSCVDPRFDPENCAGCGKVCKAATNATAACLASACVPGPCKAGYLDCSAAAEGCEIDGRTDAKNCGACGKACPVVANGGAACKDSACIIGSCLQDFADCDGKFDNGCETNLKSSAANCGKCGTTCSGAKAYCIGGVCTSVPTSCKAIKDGDASSKNGTYLIDPDDTGPIAPFQAYCDMEQDGGGWTLAARFSNADGANWMGDDGGWWYDRTAESGAPTNRAQNADAISTAFWSLRGAELKISRTDNANDAYLLMTTGGCLGSKTLREKLVSYGTYRNTTPWADNSVRGTCSASLGGNYSSTGGFGYATCASNIGAANSISFFAAWSRGDGAVLMIGGGGNSCNRADHGIGVTEANSACFADQGTGEGDFGNDAGNRPSGYALNLFVR